jgi:elongation factor P
MRGTTVENTYISGKKLETATIDRKGGQYTYSDENGNYFFMDNETFEEVMVDAKVMEDCKKWITDGMQCNLVLFKGNVIECIVPNPHVYEIVETEPTMKGNTSGAYTKPAKLSCGAMINIPGFIEQGTRVKVDTEKEEYLGRE